MADFLRVIRLSLYFLVGVMLSAVVVFAHAETIPATQSTTQYGWNSPSWFYTGTKSWEEAKAHAATYLGTSTITGFSPSAEPTTSISWQIDYRRTNGSTDRLFVSLTRAQPLYVCPTGQNWTLSGTTCSRPDCVGDQVRDSGGVCTCPVGKQLIGELCVTVCPSGYHVLTPDDGQCEKDCFGDQYQANNGKCECLKGKKTYFSGNMAQTASFQGAGDCVGGCQIKASMFSLPLGVVGAATAGSVSQWLTGGTSTGATCQGAQTTGTVKATLPPPADPVPPTPEQPQDPKTTPKNNEDPDTCASSGGIYATVNGKGKCSSPTPDNSSDAQKLTTGEKKTTTTNADGTTTESTVKNSTITNPITGDQSTTSTTTTTTKDSNGNVIGSSSSTTNGTGDKGGKGDGDGTKGFCQENPDSMICKKNTWSGDCETPPVCDGDAVLCATAKAVWEHRCVNKWAEKDNYLSNGIDKEHLFGDQAKIDAALNKDGTKDFDILATFQAKRQNYLTFSSSCNPDLSFDFRGQHYQIDTTALCQIGLVVRVLMHLAAYMMLLRILTVKLF